MDLCLCLVLHNVVEKTLYGSVGRDLYGKVCCFRRRSMEAVGRVPGVLTKVVFLRHEQGLLVTLTL